VKVHAIDRFFVKPNGPIFLRRIFSDGHQVEYNKAQVGNTGFKVELKRTLPSQDDYL
jgi:hypothetical protein